MKKREIVKTKTKLGYVKIEVYLQDDDSIDILKYILVESPHDIKGYEEVKRYGNKILLVKKIYIKDIKLFFRFIRVLKKLIYLHGIFKGDIKAILP